MKLDLKDINVSAYPDPTKRKGMTAGQLPAGVRVVHRPTRGEVTCVMHRYQHKNRESALKALQVMIEERTGKNS